jgi:hypothetical protein
VDCPAEEEEKIKKKIILKCGNIHFNMNSRWNYGQNDEIKGYLKMTVQAD